MHQSSQILKIYHRYDNEHEDLCTQRIPSKDYSNLYNLLTQVLLKEFEEVLSEKASISQQPVAIGNRE